MGISYQTMVASHLATLALVAAFLESCHSLQTSCADWTVQGTPRDMVHRHGTASATTAQGTYMFGGVDLQGGDLRDFWRRDVEGSGSWSQISTLPAAGPHERSLHSLTTTRRGGQLLLVGGQRSGAALVDCWLYSEDGGWAQLSVCTGSPGGCSPGAITAHTVISAPLSAGYDALLYGGLIVDENGTETLNNKVWALTLNNDASGLRWDLLPTNGSSAIPPARQLHSATLVEQGGESSMLVYAGCADTSCAEPCAAALLADLWRLDLGSWAWTQLSWDGNGPTGRFGHGALWVDRDGLLAVAAGSSSPTNTSALAEYLNAPATEVWLWSQVSKQWSLSLNIKCLGPVATHKSRPMFSLVTKPGYSSSQAMLFGSDDVYEKESGSDDEYPVEWGINLQPGQECTEQCSDRGVCEPEDGNQLMKCQCYPFSDTDGTSCGDNDYNFQWYLLYSAFGVTVLLLCFFLRRVYACIARRNRRLRWAEAGLIDAPESDSDTSWDQEDLDSFIGKEPQFSVSKFVDCDICMDAAADTQLLPCEHNMCSSCVCRVMGMRPECPFCRGSVGKARRLVIDPEGAVSPPSSPVAENTTTVSGVAVLDPESNVKVEDVDETVPLHC